jgi:cell division septation protein DedD
VPNRLLPLHLPQQPEDDRPSRRVLLQVDKQLPEATSLGVPVELADPLGAVKVRKAQDIEAFGATSKPSL